MKNSPVEAPLRADLLLLAAGHGKRLQPITLRMPKPLVMVGGKTLIERNLEFVRSQGIERVIINLHYKGEAIRQHLGNGERFGLEIIYSEEEVLLDTGGAIKNIESKLRHEYFFTYNSDIFLGSGLSLPTLLEEHKTRAPRALVTLALRPDVDSERYGAIGINARGRVVEFLGAVPTGLSQDERHVCQRLMFLGVAVYSKEALLQMPPCGQPFSATQDFIKNAVARGEVIGGFKFVGDWFDVGTAERLAAVEQYLLSKRSRKE